MGAGKFVFMAMMGGLGYWQQEALQENVGFAFDALPMFQAQIEMDSFKSGLGAYYVMKGRLPDPISDYLTENFNTGSKEAGIDHFGTPYEGEIDEETNLPHLRSCGPDLECYTDDDIVVRIVGKKKKRGSGDDEDEDSEYDSPTEELLDQLE